MRASMHRFVALCRLQTGGCHFLRELVGVCLSNRPLANRRVPFCSSRKQVQTSGCRFVVPEANRRVSFCNSRNRCTPPGVVLRTKDRCTKWLPANRRLPPSAVSLQTNGRRDVVGLEPAKGRGTRPGGRKRRTTCRGARSLLPEKGQGSHVPAHSLRSPRTSTRSPVQPPNPHQRTIQPADYPSQRKGSNRGLGLQKPNNKRPCDRMTGVSAI